MKPICIFLLVFLLLSGCEDIFEQDIEDASIEVIAPKNNTRTEAGTVTFLWRPLDGARSYRLTIVSPTFAGASRLVADTTLLADSAHRATVLRQHSIQETTNGACRLPTELSETRNRSIR